MLFFLLLLLLIPILAVIGLGLLFAAFVYLLVAVPVALWRQRAHIPKRVGEE